MGTRRSGVLAQLLALALALAGVCVGSAGGISAARASDQTDLADCSADDSARAIKGCSAVLSRGALISASIRKIALTYRAMAYLDQSDFTHALTDADALVHLSPNEPALKSLHGRALAGLDRHEEAIADFSQAIDADPKDVDDLLRRAKSFAAIGDRKRALADFEAVTRFRFTQAQPFLELGRFQFDGGDYEAALDTFKHAVTNGPNNALAYYWRGRAWEKEADLDKAAVDFDAATHINPKLAAAWLERGIIYEKAGDEERAQDCFRRAAGGDPRDPDVIAAVAKLTPPAKPTDQQAMLTPKSVDVPTPKLDTPKIDTQDKPPQKPSETPQISPPVDTTSKQPTKTDPAPKPPEPKPSDTGPVVVAPVVVPPEPRPVQPAQVDPTPKPPADQKPPVVAENTDKPVAKPIAVELAPIPPLAARARRL